jgi:hypothetical protein
VKTTCNTGLVKLTLSSMAAAALAACGGGGGGSTASTPAAPTASTQVTGKAIDGYLAGATVCIDDGKGACDPSQPSTTTDVNGNYSLKVAGGIAGKTIDVIVSSTTTDTTNGNAAFQNGFTLSAVLQAGSSQNVTPLTSMVAAQVKKGLSFADATTAVQGVAGTGVDPAADYVANGDTHSASLAAQVVGTMQAYAANGTVTPAIGINVLNAIVAAGTLAAVTPASVLAQANAVAAPVDATTALAQPLHVIDDFLVGVSAFTAGQTSQSPVVNFALRDTYTLSGSTLSVGQEQFTDGAWAPISPVGVWDVQKNTGLGVTLLDGSTGVFEMKADGSWTDFLPNAQLHPAISVTPAGSGLAGTDPNTGIGYSLTYRQADVSGQPFASAVPFYYSLAGEGAAAPLMTGAFASGSNVYLGSTSYAADQVILPVDPDTAQTSLYGSDTSSDFGESLAVNGVAIADPNILGAVGQTYTSVQQVIGMPLSVGIDPKTGGVGGTLVLSAGGQFQITGLPVYASYPPATANTVPATTTVNVNGTWTTYARNPNVLVLTLPASFRKAIYSQDNVTEAILDGAKFVIALHNGRLKSGFLIPAGTTVVTPQFAGNVADQLGNALLAAGTQLVSQQPLAASQKALIHQKAAK